MQINSKHLVLILWGLTIVSMKTNITHLLQSGGRDSWISIIVASIISLFFLLFTMKMFIKIKKLNITEIYQGALGKIIGNIFLFLLLFNYFLTLVESSCVEANAMHTNLFIETPVWYLAIFFIFPAIYTVSKGLYPVVAITIIGMLLAIFAGINLVTLTAKYKDFRLLLPILANGITPGIILCTLKALGYYAGMLIIYPYLPFLKDTKKIKKHLIIGFLFVVQMQILSVTGTIASFGADRVVNIAYPKLLQTQEINYFGFIESGELFVMFQIIGGWFVKYVLTLFAFLNLLKTMNFYNKYSIYVISIIVFISTFFIGSNLFYLNFYLNFFSYFSLINFMLVPFIVLTIHHFKK